MPGRWWRPAGGQAPKALRGGDLKPTSISAEALFEAHREAMRWEWIAGHAHPERRFDEAAVRDARSAADLVGYLNYIHPYRVQIVGRREVAYLQEASEDDQEDETDNVNTAAEGSASDEAEPAEENQRADEKGKS